MNLSLNLDQMLFNNLHVGVTINFFDSQLKGALIGLRKKTTILNLKISIIELQLLSNLIINLTTKRAVVFLIREWSYVNYYWYIRRLFPFKNLIVWEQRWIGGILTNYKSVFNSKKLKPNNYTINLITNKKSRRFPSLICFFDSNLSKHALFESSTVDVPIASLIDSDSRFFNLINYPVISNNKSVNASLLYLTTILNSLLYGRKKEMLKILQFEEDNSVEDDNIDEDDAMEEDNYYEDSGIILYRKDDLLIAKVIGLSRIMSIFSKFDMIESDLYKTDTEKKKVFNYIKNRYIYMRRMKKEKKRKQMEFMREYAQKQTKK